MRDEPGARLEIDAGPLSTLVVARLGLDGSIDATNAGFERLVGDAAQDGLDLLVSPTFSEIRQGARSASPGETVHEGRITVLTGDGQGATLDGWIEREAESLLLVGEPEVEHLATVDQRLMEINGALAATQRELQREMRERARLEAQHLEDVERRHRERLERDRLRTLKRVVNRLAHELGTPLTPLKLDLFMLSEAVEDASVKARVQDVEQGLSRVEEVVGSIRALAGLDEGDAMAEGRTADLAAALQQAAEAAGSIADERDVTVEIEHAGPARVAADAALLARGVEALVHETVEASPRGSTRRFTVTSDGDRVVLDVPATPEDAAEGDEAAPGEVIPLGRLILGTLIEQLDGRLDVGPDRVRFTFPAATEPATSETSGTQDPAGE